MITAAEKQACAERELKFRKRVYPRLIDSGQLSSEKAAREIETMQAIADDYRALAAGKRLL